MPTYTTQVIHDTSNDFSDNPQTITEAGRPESVTMQGLTPNTAHFVKAKIFADGVLNDESEVETFTTLPAGQLSLTFSQTVRSGYIYDYSWIYSSLYAPSYATCTCNGITVNGFFDYNQHVLNFNVPGLTSPNTTYPTTIVLTDIYGFTDTVQHSITTTYVNNIYILDTDAEENFVDVGLSYVVDGGFFSGWVDVWYDYQDPSTDMSLQHYSFSEGDTVIHCDGLTANTGYLFRASITLDDRTTVINSNVVEVSTAAAIVPVNFTDITGVANTLTLTKNGSAPTIDLEYSTDNSTWTTWTESNNVRTLIIPANGTVYIRGNNANGLATNESNYHSFSSTGNVNAAGDITTLINKNGTTALTSTGCFCNLFKAMSTLKTSPDLTPTTLSNKCYRGMYEDCSGLVVAPSLPATAVPDEAYFGMFCRCTSMTTPPSTIPATTIGSNACRVMFDGCSSLSSAPTLPALSVGNMGYRTMFRNCTNLRTPADLPATTLGGSCYEEMYRGSGITTPPVVAATSVPSWSFSNTFAWCSNLTEGVDFSKVTAVENNSFYHTYDSCHNLIKAYAPKIAWSTDKTPDWLASVADSGTLYADESIASSITLNSTSGCPTGWNIKEVYTFLAFRDVSGDSNTLTLTKNGTAPAVNLEYSTDKTNWSTWTESNGVRTVTIPANGIVYLRGDNANGFASDYDSYHSFSSTGNVNAEGDLNRIINKEGSTSVPRWAFAFLFANMSTLKTAPELPATTLSDSCYKQLFVGTGISSAPVLPATTLADSCYQEMFVFTQSLRTPPELPATTLASYCYNSMFGYSAITTAPVIPATTIPDGACRAMFEWCGSLATPPQLPNATTVGDYAFSNTFYGCGNMTEGIGLRKITNVGYRAFEGLYIDNRSLNVAYAPTITWNSETTEYWLYGVAATGTLYADESIISGIPTNSESGCPTGWNVEKSLEQQYFTIKNEYNGNNNITMYASDSRAATTVYVSLDNGSTWTAKTTSTSQTVLATLRSGEKMLMKHSGALGTVFNGHNYIYSDRDYSVQGNVASLTAGDNFTSNITLPQAAFSHLFDTYSSNKLVSCENLVFSSITTLDINCFEYMFNNCTLITKSPELPNVNTIPNNAYNAMFYGCSSLITAPKLNAQEIGQSGCLNMFSGCSNLLHSPELPATTLGTSAYMSMFYGCSSLTTAPTTLPATRLANNVYNSMFSGCSSLTTVPSELPAGTPATGAYRSMFSGCSSITKAPVINLGGLGTNIGSIVGMFSNCTSLNEIKLSRIMSWNSENATDWVNGVAATGTFTKPSGTTIPTGTNGIPSGWTVVNV